MLVDVLIVDLHAEKTLVFLDHLTNIRDVELVVVLDAREQLELLFHSFLARARDRNVAVCPLVLCLNVDLNGGQDGVVSLTANKLTHDNVSSIPATFFAARFRILF